MNDHLSAPSSYTAESMEYISAEMWIGKGMSNNRTKHVSFFQLWEKQIAFTELWEALGLGLYKNESVETFEKERYPDIWSDFLAAV